MSLEGNLTTREVSRTLKITIKSLNPFWTYQEEVVVLRLSPQVLEDDLLHEALH